MDTMNRFRSLIWSAALTVAVLFTASPLFAQTALSATTFSAAVDNVQQTVTVASATGITAAGSGAGFVYLLADHELFAVRALPGASTTVTVMRGQNGTRATSHINGATVTVVPPLALINYLPTGQCTRSNLLYVPMVVGGTIDQAFNGTTLDCLGVTTAGQWVQTNLNGFPVFGSTVASATTISATGTYFKVSGTTAVATINLPAGAAAGFYITIEATGVLTWTAAGNILTAGTYTAAGHTVTFYWNGTKWVPDKVA
jgi:hypothetical protein